MNTVARYSVDFKKNAVSMFKREGITRTSRQLHVTRATIYRWVKQDDSLFAECSEKNNGATAVAEREKEPQAMERIR